MLIPYLPGVFYRRAPLTSRNIAVSSGDARRVGERCERCLRQGKRAERVAAATSLPAASGGVKGKRSECFYLWCACPRQAIYWKIRCALQHGRQDASPLRRAQQQPGTANGEGLLEQTLIILQCIKLVIPSVQSKELLVGALLDDLALGE